MTAVVGRAGSGKTTLASMVPRFLTPTSGRVLWDAFPGLKGTEFEGHYRRALDGQVSVSFTARSPVSGRTGSIRGNPVMRSIASPTRSSRA